jgi:aminoglycoside phosphotransferase (APT) family kinase protein
MTELAVFEARRGDLERWIAAVMPEATSVALSPFTPVSSGFSNVTLFTELRWTAADGDHFIELVLRVQPAEGGMFPNYDLRLQYDVMAALTGTAVPVPKVKWFIDDPAVMGAPCFLMHRVHGEVASGFRPGFHGHGLFFDASLDKRRQMWLACLDVIAELHILDTATLSLPHSLVRYHSGRDAVLGMLEVIEQQLQWAEIGPPVLDVALHYLRANAPQSAGLALCWGDGRPGNLIYRDGRVAAALDWELAHVCPPEADVAYLLLIDEVVAELNDVPRLPGLPDAAETIGYYESRTGRPLENLDFHRTLQALRLAAMLVLTVRLSPPQLSFPSDYLTNNVPTRRLAELLGTST